MTTIYKLKSDIIQGLEVRSTGWKTPIYPDAPAAEAFLQSNEVTSMEVSPVENEYTAILRFGCTNRYHQSVPFGRVNEDLCKQFAYLFYRDIIENLIKLAIEIERMDPYTPPAVVARRIDNLIREISA